MTKIKQLKWPEIKEEMRWEIRYLDKVMNDHHQLSDKDKKNSPILTYITQRKKDMMFLFDQTINLIEDEK